MKSFSKMLALAGLIASAPVIAGVNAWTVGGPPGGDTYSIAFHPTNPNVWGLKNLANDKWVATTAGGEVRDVPPGRTVTIATGTRIQFGYSEGILRL